MNLKLFAFLSVAALVFLPMSVNGETHISANIDSPTTWVAAGSPYIIDNSIAINSTLTVDQGVTVQVSKFSQLTVNSNGTLNAVGTSGFRITFTGTSESAGWWNSIYIQGSGSATFDYCDIGYAGYSTGANIYKTGTGSLTLTNSTSHHSSEDGLWLNVSTGPQTFANNAYSNNARNGVHLGINMSYDDNTSTFSTNGCNLYADGGTIASNVTWNVNKNYSLYLSGSIDISGSSTLTVKPGTVVKMAKFLFINVYGTLTAVGTSADPIYFTDFNDDTVGGDANNDAALSVPAAGWWNCINIITDGAAANGSAVFDYCTIRYGGYSGAMNIGKNGSGNLTLTNSTVSNGSVDGLKISTSTGTHTITNCTFKDNVSSGFVLLSSLANVTNCTFQTNAYGIWQSVNQFIDYSVNTFTGNTSAAVGVSGGNMTNDVTWEPGQGTGFFFYMNDSVTVDAGVTFDIAAGTVVKFTKFEYLAINGTLDAQGTAGSRITFTGTTESAGWWNSISISGAGSAIFDYCDIGYAGYSTGANVYKTGTKNLTFTNSTSHHSSEDGLWLNVSTGTHTFANNDYSNNTRYGVHLGNNMSYDDNTSTFSTNGCNLYADGGTITSNVTWNVNKNYSVYLSGSIDIGGNSTLTVKPGTVVKMAKFLLINVYGTLNAVGNAANPIYFTDVNDDTVGGDTNNDSGAATPAPGWWNCINIITDGATANGSAVFDYCTIRYGGYSGGMNIGKNGSGNLTLTNSTVSNGSVDGLKINTSTGLHTITNCTFKDNGSSGFVLLSSLANVTNCTFQTNAYGIWQSVNQFIDYSINTFTGNTSAAVGVSGGSMTNDVTWEPGQGANFFFHITGDIDLNTDKKLTILPGTTIKCDRFRIFFINGILDAQGTAGSRITFTGMTESAGWWNSIYIQNAGSAIFDFCDISYAGYSTGANVYKTGTGNLTFSNSTSHHCGGDGLWLNVSTGTHTFANNAYSDNARYGVHLGINMSYDDNTSTFSTNGCNLYADGGIITSNVVWNVNKNYSLYLSGGIDINENFTLTVKPGTAVKMAKFLLINVYGTMSAAGTVTDPIYFTDANDDTVGGDTNNDSGATTPTPGWWNCINIQTNGTATFNYCTIRYGGYSGGMNINKGGAGNLSISNSAVSYGSANGLTISGSSGINTIVASSFRENGGAGLSISGSTVNVSGSIFSNNAYGLWQSTECFIDYPTNIFTDNTTAPVGVAGGSVTSDVIWAPGQGTNFFFHVTGDIDLNAGKTFTLLPGTIVKFNKYRLFYVNGTLLAQGTSSSLVVFTGTDPSSNWWNSIYIQNAGSATFENCSVSGAGYSTGANIYKTGSGDLALKNCTTENSGGSGLAIAGSTGLHSISFSTFQNNPTGISISDPPAGLKINNCTIAGNTNWGVNNSSATVDVDARGNWWGNSSGPQHATNPSGTGDKVSNHVLFEPWKSNQNISHIMAPIRSGEIVAGDTLNFIGQQPSTGNYSYSWDLAEDRKSNLLVPGLVTFAGSTGDIEEKVTFATVNAEGVTDPYPDNKIFMVKPATGTYPDLKATAFNVPATLQVGQIYNMSYSAQNIGKGGISNASWKDAIYLSTDKYLDDSDTLLSLVDVKSKTLAVGQSYNGSIPTYIPAVKEGQSFLILSIDDNWTILEKHQLNNEFPSSSSLGVPALTSGEKVTDSFGMVYTPKYYKIIVTEGQSMFFSFSGNVIVYFKFGAFPSMGQYDYRMTLGEGGKITIPGMIPGAWYIMVIPDPGSSSTDFEFTPEVKDFILSDVTPKQCSNSTDIVLTLAGAGFGNGATVELENSTGTTYPASSTEIYSFSKASATFLAGTVPGGDYTVRISQSGKDAELANALTVVENGKAELSINLVLPERMGYHQLATIYVEYANKGNIPMQSPLLFLTATQKGKLGALMTMDRERLTEGFWTSAIPQGFSNTVQILAGGKIPGILQPGETRRVPVYYAGWKQPWDMSYPPFDFRVGAITADNTTVIEWNTLKNSLKPPFLSNDEWNPIFNNFVAQVGSTWGNFVSMLSRNASYLSKVGSQIDDAKVLLGFEYLLANGAGPERIICSEIDSSMETQGIPLGFARIYPTLLSLRKSSGLFGKGWISTWDSSLSESEDGTVQIYSGACRRTFQPDSRGGYFADAGDYATLSKVSGAWTLRENTGTLFSFGADGKQTSIEDLNGNKISIEYSGGKPVKLTHTSGATITIAYNASGKIASVTDNNDRTTTYSYDASGELLISCTLFDGQTTSYTYYAEGSDAVMDTLKSVTYSDGTGDIFTYQPDGKISSISEIGGGSISYTYDGGKATATDNDGNAFTVFIDQHGWTTSIKDTLEIIDSLTVLDNSNLMKVSDTNGTPYSFGYDSTGNMSGMIEPTGASSSFTYSNNSRIASSADPLGNKTEYTSDTKGNLTKIKDSAGKLREFTYSAAGSLLSDTNRRGQKTNYEYNPMGSLTTTTFPDSSQTVFAYDKYGNITSFTDPIGTTTITYDAKQRLEKITYPGNLYLQYEYDDVGRRTKMTDQAGHAVKYTYNVRGFLDKVSDENDNLVTSFTYDSTGRITRKNFGNGTYATYKFTADERISEINNFDPADSIVSSFKYSFNAAGRISKMETPEGDWTYTYDGTGQLTSASFVSDNPAQIPDKNITYSYDSAGNRTQVSVNAVSTNYGVNNLNQYTAIGETTLNYDSDGNMTSKAGIKNWVFSYDSAGRLIKAEDGTDTCIFKYNGLGQRVSVSLNGTEKKYVFDPVGFGELVGEYDDSNQLLAHYDYGVELASRLDADGSRYYYNFDASGNTSELTNSAGAIANTYRFQPFGETLKASETTANIFKFCGADALPTDSTGLVHMHARSYDPASGRFIQPDPIGIGGGMNLYAYVYNNPVELTDPSGMITGNPASIPIPGIDPRSGAGLEWAQNQFTQEALNSSKAYNGSKRFVNEGVKKIVSKGTFVNGSTVQNAEKAAKLARDARFSAAVKAKRIREAAEAGRKTATAVRTATSGAEAGAAQGGKLSLGGPIVIATTIWTGAAIIVSGVGYLSGSEEVSDAGTSMFDALSPSGWAVAWDYYFGDSDSAQSQDPNQKIGPSGYGQSHYVNGSLVFSYRIDFENFSTATAPAQVVSITDQLSSNLDWNTLEFTEFGFGDHIISVPDNTTEFSTTEAMVLNEKNLDAIINAKIDQTGRLNVLFNTIDPDSGLPPEVDYGFLPPEDGTGRGKGYFCFTIKPKAGLATGAEIRNIADIVFDFSKTIATNQVSPEDPTPDPTKECQVTIDNTKPVSEVADLQASSPLEFKVEWTGTDAECGVQSYTIFVQDNGGAFVPWLQNTTRTYGVYPGTDGHTYGFYCLAMDNVGNIEAAKIAAEATTTASSSQKSIPILYTTAITAHGSDRLSGGNILTDGGLDVTARGVCWSIFHNPTTANSRTTDGTGEGEFESLIDELQPDNTYYVRAYATNSLGTAYGDELSFQTLKTDKLLLTVVASPLTGGTVTPAVPTEVDPDVATAITATPAGEYIFLGWSVTEGEAVIDDTSSAATTATISKNATVTGHFITELFADPLPKITIQLDNSKPSKDSVSITKGILPNLPEGYDPKNDSVSIVIDEFEFVIDPTTWKANSKGTVFTAKSPKSETDPLSTTLVFDMAKKTWSFKAAKASINQKVDNSDGVFICLKADSKYFGEKFPMSESTGWTTAGEELRLIGLGGTTMTEFSLQTAKIKGSYNSLKENKDAFSVEKGILQLPGAFTPDAESSLLIHNLEIVLGPYTKNGDKEVYTFKTPKETLPAVTSTIDFVKNLWTVKMSKGNCSLVGSKNEGLDIILNLGVYRDGAKVKFYKKTKLTYTPPKI